MGQLMWLARWVSQMLMKVDLSNRTRRTGIITGTMYCMKEELKHIGRGCSIVNVASFSGVQGVPKFAVYSAAKHGMVGLKRSVAKEIGIDRIRVNVVVSYVRIDLI